MPFELKTSAVAIHTTATTTTTQMNSGHLRLEEKQLKFHDEALIHELVEFL